MEGSRLGALFFHGCTSNVAPIAGQPNARISSRAGASGGRRTGQNHAKARANGSRYLSRIDYRRLEALADKIARTEPRRLVAAIDYLLVSTMAAGLPPGAQARSCCHTACALRTSTKRSPNVSSTRR